MSWSDKENNVWCVLMAEFSLYVQKGSLKPHLFISLTDQITLIVNEIESEIFKCLVSNYKIGSSFHPLEVVSRSSETQL